LIETNDNEKVVQILFCVEPRTDAACAIVGHEVKQTVSSHKKQPELTGAKQKGRNCAQTRRIDQDMMRERNIAFALVRCLPMRLQHKICNPVHDQKWEIGGKCSAHDLASVSRAFSVSMESKRGSSLLV